MFFFFLFCFVFCCCCWFFFFACFCFVLKPVFLFLPKTNSTPPASPTRSSYKTENRNHLSDQPCNWWVLCKLAQSRIQMSPKKANTPCNCISFPFLRVELATKLLLSKSDKNTSLLCVGKVSASWGHEVSPYWSSFCSDADVLQHMTSDARTMTCRK